MHRLQLRLFSGPLRPRQVKMLEPPVLTALQDALKDLRYGTVQLTVHDGKLVRIERLEKIRLPTEPIGGTTEQQPSG